ncbi:MAG: type II toxin-antitoxin system RelE/ParE family toxin [Clostridia bacterium]|nr:type II toxin-antitoxin system RelE/ParE family toxin [Clostridia bacterium]
MMWRVVYLPEAKKDFTSLAGNQRILVAKAIEKVRRNPLPVSEGGYGKPLGSKSDSRLTGFLKIKLRDAGLRVVYKLVRTDSEMLIVVIGARADNEVYGITERRSEKYNL